MTIGRSFLLWLLAVLLIVLVVVSSLVLWHEQKLLERELVERSEMLARALVVAATDDRSPVFPAALSLTDLRSGEVRGASGEVLWSYGLPPDQALELDPELLRVEVAAGPGGPLGVPASTRAVLLVSRTRISAAIATAAVRLVLALAVVLPVALLVGLLVVERIVRPLRRLGDFLRGLDPAVKPVPPDLGTAATEVADLARTTFEMAERMYTQRASMAASERRFRELFLDSPTPLFQVDDRLVVRAANPLGAALLGVAVEDAGEADLLGWLGDRAVAEILARVAAADAGTECVVEAAWPSAHDSGVDAELHARALGAGTALVAVHDLTERTRRMAERWRRTFDAMDDGVALLAADGSVVVSNRAMTTLRPWLDDLAEDRLSERELGSWRAEAGGRVLQCALSPMAEGAERILVVRDVTEAVVAEERLREAEKLEAIGTLASGVAHDFNNLLAGIQLQARLLRRDPEAGDEPIAAILDLADEGSEVVRELLVYAQRERTPLQRLDLGELVRGQEAVLRHLTPANARLRLELTAGPVPVMASPVALRRMVLNLVLNARAAVTEGGEVRVAVTAEPGWAVLEVADDGVGIDPADLPRVFEPFYTTRRSGRGAGLGLAVVQRVVSDHRGRVGVESVPGRGTHVRVRLPLAATDDDDLSRAVNGIDGLPAGPRVLVVMADVERAAELMAELAARGGDPRHARSAAEAAERVREDRPQVVVADARVVGPAAGWTDPGVPVVVAAEQERGAGRDLSQLTVSRDVEVDRLAEAVIAAARTGAASSTPR